MLSQEWTRGEYTISTDRQRLNLDVIHSFLSKSYWAAGRSQNRVARSIEHCALTFGLYHQPTQVDFRGPQEGPTQVDPRGPTQVDFHGPQGPTQVDFRGPTQVGFARVLTDQVVLAFLADVFILPEHRGRGLGVWLVETITSLPQLSSVRRWLLGTRDAHTLYARFGFSEPPPGILMERLDPESDHRGG